MELMRDLESRWSGNDDHPFLFHADGFLTFSNLRSQNVSTVSNVCAGDVVALIGDFDPLTIATFIKLTEQCAVIMPLTADSRDQHEYFFEAAAVNWVIEGSKVIKREPSRDAELLEVVRRCGHPGLILFSTGTTGKPKAILHDFSIFLKRFSLPRPTLRTLNFLLFDHIGGINTLFHTLFNGGTIIAPASRQVSDILEVCWEYDVELLPATPTFLRMLLLSDLLPAALPPSVKIITYGTERMDQATLDHLCRLLPDVDFRQTYGMSELGILRVKSKARDSLYMSIGGEGVETQIIDGTLRVRAENRMVGYLNAPQPFTEEGWYDTKDVVDVDGDYLRISGRNSDVINVGGLKFMARDVESVALDFPGVEMVKVEAKDNPITGQHVELSVQCSEHFDATGYKQFLSDRLPAHMKPRKVKYGDISLSHRFKKL